MINTRCKYLTNMVPFKLKLENLKLKFDKLIEVNSSLDFNSHSAIFHSTVVFNN